MVYVVHGERAVKSAVALLALLLAASAYAGTAHKTGEQRTGGTKQCYYIYLGNPYTITVKWHEVCPRTIEVS